MKSTEEHIQEVCNDIAAFLIEKNRSYGDSAVRPIRIFAKGMSVEDMINVRMDDKLSRLLRGDLTTIHAKIENTEEDLLGYLVLKRVSRRVAEEEETARVQAEEAPATTHAQAINKAKIVYGEIVTGATRPRDRFEGAAPEDDLQCVAVNGDNVRCRRASDHDGPHRAGIGGATIEWPRSGFTVADKGH